MRPDVVSLLSERGIQPSAQRVAVAQYVLFTDEHPSADRVWARVRSRFPMISRATVYNTLNLFVEKGLVREVHLSPDSVVFDPNTDAHHHFIDEETGRIYDVPWQKVAMREAPDSGGIRDPGLPGRHAGARRQPRRAREDRVESNRPRRNVSERRSIVPDKEHTKSASESENPAIPAPTPKRSRPRTNKDWWPNQLDLSVLHQPLAPVQPDGRGLQLRGSSSSPSTSRR